MIASVLPYLFVIQHIVTGEMFDVHSTRFKYYHDDSVEVNDELVDHISLQGVTLVVQSIIGIV